MGNKGFILGAAALLASVCFSSAANAQWAAFFYEDYTGNSATAADIPASGEQFVGFIPGIWFNSYDGTADASKDYTIGSWLKSGGVTYTGALAGDSMDDTLWVFVDLQNVGASPGHEYTITHDDGVSMYLGGFAVSGFTSGPTSPATETGIYTGPPFYGELAIVYNECCGPPAVLEVSVPEPSTWAMMLLGFAGLGYAGYRGRRSAVAAAF